MDLRTVATDDIQPEVDEAGIFTVEEDEDHVDLEKDPNSPCWSLLKDAGVEWLPGKRSGGGAGGVLPFGAGGSVGFLGEHLLGGGAGAAPLTRSQSASHTRRKKPRTKTMRPASSVGEEIRSKLQWEKDRFEARKAAEEKISGAGENPQRRGGPTWHIKPSAAAGRDHQPLSVGFGRRNLSPMPSTSQRVALVPQQSAGGGPARSRSPPDRPEQLRTKSGRLRGLRDLPNTLPTVAVRLEELEGLSEVESPAPPSRRAQTKEESTTPDPPRIRAREKTPPPIDPAGGRGLPTLGGARVRDEEDHPGEFYDAAPPRTPSPLRVSYLEQPHHGGGAELPKKLSELVKPPAARGKGILPTGNLFQKWLFKENYGLK